MDISKAIIPAAGLGTRFLPYTKAIPKEMIPLIDKPAIQYSVEEALSAGINNFLVITGRDKQAIANHFDLAPNLEAILEEKGLASTFATLNKIIRNAYFTYIRQPEPLGLGHAVWMARHCIGKEYFSVMLPDDIIVNKQPGLAQLIRVARQEKASVIAIQEIPPECSSSYGVIEVKKQITPNLFQIGHIIEKPHQKDAPSNLGVIGRYVLSHKIFSSIEEISNYAVGELQLTDAISHMMKNGEKVYAYKIQGTRYDIGTPIGWIKAIISMSLQDPVYGAHIRKYINDVDTVDSFLYNNSKNIEHLL